MAEDWSIDVRRYVPNADLKVIDAIVRYCGISLQNHDSSLVSFSDVAEVGRVRENYLKKKLGLTGSDTDLDEAISDVGERMKADRTKNRVTVYYLLAEHFRKLSVFGGVDGGGIGKATLAVGALGAGAAAASVANAATDASATVADFADRPRRVEDRPPPAAPVYAASSTAAASAASGGMGRWLPWVLGLAALALLAWFLLGRQTATTTAPVAEVKTAPPAAVAAPVEAAPTTAPSPAITSAPAPAATRVAIVALPAAVHFALGSAAVGGDDGRVIDEAAAAIKQDSLKVAVTGYTDRTGNPAINAPLAKQRAEAVRDRLIAAGVSAGDIEMVEPATVENGATGVADGEARRVEISRR
jgi:outer membrane protein OmpA-like peptidoglycan-associated protein